ncbi:uncharacterized protein EV422DRAFT_582201 [Fimicolochytrium jonesii]|uniref:uncharacterized protein n=1 Tax=Fimicolochytrium jonesii TaxID=1396493 RepID=UPI0022FECE8D|nr:uncharacterized protein EV422DRAFT_582201 [Fimicolochytrium jonesii]KAI8826656.1 hypothetical protein EV422DRAFT_582201 [Fimicolochytrium jonesii]
MWLPSSKTPALAALLASLLLLTLTPPTSASPSITKIRRLEAKLSSNGAIRLDGSDYFAITEAPRNYSLFVCLTALAPEMGCAPCREFEKEFDLVASSWQRAKVPRTLYFGQLDFAAGREVFQKLQVQSVPMILHFPPTEGPLATGGSEPEPYDLNKWGLQADPLAKYASNVVKHEFPIRRPVNYTLYGIVGIAILLALTLIKVLWPVITAIVQNRKIWSTLLIAWVVTMCSGHMWNSIRGPPYTGMRDNRPEVIAPGFQNQFVLETQLVAVLYAACSIAFVALVTKVPAMSQPFSQRTAAYAFAGVFVVIYSIMLKLFRLKNGGYPYKLLF